VNAGFGFPLLAVLQEGLYYHHWVFAFGQRVLGQGAKLHELINCLVKSSENATVFYFKKLVLFSDKSAQRHSGMLLGFQAEASFEILPDVELLPHSL